MLLIMSTVFQMNSQGLAAKSKPPIVSRIIKDIGRSPISYATTMFLGAILIKDSKHVDPNSTVDIKENNDSSPDLLKGTILASVLAYHGVVFTRWWSLGTDLDLLREDNSTGLLLQRTFWGGTHNFRRGYHIWKYYSVIDTKQKKSFIKQLSLEVQSQNIDEALTAIEEDIDKYSYYSPILYKLARSAGYTKNPKALLTTDYLLYNDIDNNNVRDEFDRNMSGSVIARSFTVRLRWSSFLGIAVPHWYTWSYQKASECIWELLHKYGRLKAIKKILEQYIKSEKIQNINHYVDGKHILGQI